MNKDMITFRLETDKKKALDAIASGMDRDRSYVLNEAITAYLEVHEWHLSHIREGLRQADAGAFATDAQVADAFAKWRRSR